MRIKSIIFPHFNESLHKTVEVSGQSSPVDIESRIDDIKQQIRKCEISKLKARARLETIKKGLILSDWKTFPKTDVLSSL